MWSEIASSLSRISLTCFASCYGLAFGLETTRFFSRAKLRNLAVLILLGVGLLAQTIYLWVLVREEVGRIVPLARWYDWCLMVVWVLAALCLVITFRRPQTAIALFLLPTILALIGASALLAESPPFSQAAAVGIWGAVHGLALLLGTVTVALGFAAGLMYLYQSNRLKHKRPPTSGLKLPSLEWMERTSRSALFVSTGLLAAGLLAGVFINLVADTVAWGSPVVVSSSVLFLWLVAATLFEWLYKPARRGRKMAYLTVANFVFLTMVLFFVLFDKHASSDVEAKSRLKSPVIAQSPQTQRSDQQRPDHLPQQPSPLRVSNWEGER